MKRISAALAALVFLFGLSVAGQAPAPATMDKVPALTEVQKLQVQNLAQSIEIAQLRAQQAQRDFDTARAELGKLIQSLQRDGYTLDLTKLEYTKAQEPIKK